MIVVCKCGIILICLVEGLELLAACKATDRHLLARRCFGLTAGGEESGMRQSRNI